MSGKICGNLKNTQKRSCLNLCFQQFDDKHVDIVIFVIVICVTAKPTVIMITFFRSLKERVHSVHITYILRLVNNFHSENGACSFLQNLVKNFTATL